MLYRNIAIHPYYQVGPNNAAKYHNKNDWILLNSLHYTQNEIGGTEMGIYLQSVGNSPTVRYGCYSTFAHRRAQTYDLYINAMMCHT